jgi:hypothetical protein
MLPLKKKKQAKLHYHNFPGMNKTSNTRNSVQNFNDTHSVNHTPEFLCTYFRVYMSMAA